MTTRREGVICLTIVAIVGFIGFLSGSIGASTRINTPECRQVSFGPVAELGPQLSPNGKLIAFEYFHRTRPNVPQIWLMDRSLGFQSARPLVDNPNYNAEFSWSPDGEWISYINHSLVGSLLTSQIFKVGVKTGRVEQITEFQPGKALGDSTSWSKDGLIAFEDEDDIYAVGEFGGEPVRLVPVRSSIPSLSPSEIRWSPDGSRLVFTGKEHSSSSETSAIWIAEAKTGRLQRVTNSKADGTPSWFDGERILFSRGVSEFETNVCLLTLRTGVVECITAGAIDLSPWRDAGRPDVYLARGSRSSMQQHPTAFFGGFHVCSVRLKGPMTQ